MANFNSYVFCSFKRILVSFYNIRGASRAARLQPSHGNYASVAQTYLMKGTCEQVGSYNDVLLMS